FCQSFNFELQAAATEEALVLSLGPMHSFALEEVFRYLNPKTVRETLVQAVLDSPIFETRWRWTTTLALAVPRSRNGAKLPAQIQRMIADELLAAIFPDAAACLDNIQGARAPPGIARGRGEAGPGATTPAEPAAAWLLAGFTRAKEAPPGWRVFFDELAAAGRACDAGGYWISVERFAELAAVVPHPAI